MASTALSKFLHTFKTPQHDYKISTELFGQFDPNKVAKELHLEEKGAEKGAENLPTASSQIPDEIESLISERLESAKIKANEIAEDHIQTYSDRISNLDFEGYFAQLRQVGPMAINDLKTKHHDGLNEMNGPRKSLHDIEKEYKFFRKENRLENRTARMNSGLHHTISILFIIIMLFAEVVLNGWLLGKNNVQGFFGGFTDAFYFAGLNIFSSILITNYWIRQIVRPSFFKKLIGLLGVVVWILLVLSINFALAHFKETSGNSFQLASEDVMIRILERPFDLQLMSWVLFAVGIVFACATLIDIWFYNDVFPGYSQLQSKWENEQQKYKNSFEESIDNLSEIIEDYQDDLKKISADLTLRQQELDKILTGKNRLIALYDSHNDHLQRSADVLFSAYFESNKSSRTKPAPKRYNIQHKIKLPKLSSGENFSSREAKKIKKKIDDAKLFLDEQVSEVLAIFSDSIEKYNNLDKLDIERSNGQK